jgi:hypothetical protein
VVQENAILQDDGVKEIAILPDVEGDVDNAASEDGGGQENGPGKPIHIGYEGG